MLIAKKINNHASITRNAKAIGLNTKQKMIKVFVNLASKKKIKNWKISKLIKTDIILMIAKLKVVKKVWFFKKLNTVKLFIVENVLKS